MVEWQQYGVLGLCVLGLAGYIVSIEKRHREERREWRSTIDKQFDEANKATRETTSILHTLKTMLENRR